MTGNRHSSRGRRIICLLAIVLGLILAFASLAPRVDAAEGGDGGRQDLEDSIDGAGDAESEEPLVDIPVARDWVRGFLQFVTAFYKKTDSCFDAATLVLDVTSQATDPVLRGFMNRLKELRKPRRLAASTHALFASQKVFDKNRMCANSGANTCKWMWGCGTSSRAEKMYEVTFDPPLQQLCGASGTEKKEVLSYEFCVKDSHGAPRKYLYFYMRGTEKDAELKPRLDRGSLIRDQKASARAEYVHKLNRLGEADSQRFIQGLAIPQLSMAAWDILARQAQYTKEMRMGQEIFISQDVLKAFVLLGIGKSRGEAARIAFADQDNDDDHTAWGSKSARKARPRLGGAAPKPPISEEIFASWFDREGKLKKTEVKVREQIFNLGLDKESRPLAWNYLFGVYKFDSTKAQRAAVKKDLTSEYCKMKKQWKELVGTEPRASQTVTPDDGSQSWKLRESKFLIEKDVTRTNVQNIPYFDPANRENDAEIPCKDDSPEEDAPENIAGNGGYLWDRNLAMMRDILQTYAYMDPVTEYCQGMSDLAGIIIDVVRDEVEAYWSFVGLMKIAKDNFRKDQRGIKASNKDYLRLLKFMDPQLQAKLVEIDTITYYPYHYFLLWFTRTFVLPDTVRLWDSLFSNYLTAYFHQFLAAAIVLESREKILKFREFEDLVMLAREQEEEKQIPMLASVEKAEKLFSKFKYKIQKEGFDSATSEEDQQALKKLLKTKWTGIAVDRR